MTLLDIPLEELIRIKKEIEGTAVNEKSVANREFSWLYRKDKPLELMKIISTTPESSALQMLGVGIEFEDYENTDALAHLHNHPSGLMVPTVGDNACFLRSIKRNKDLKYELIASSKGGFVNGFYVLEYEGDRNDANDNLTRLEKCFRKHVEDRNKEMSDFPERFEHIGVGDSIFTLEEYTAISLEIMELIKARHYAVALPGFKFSDWQFLPE